MLLKELRQQWDDQSKVLQKLDRDVQRSISIGQDNDRSLQDCADAFRHINHTLSAVFSELERSNQIIEKMKEEKEQTQKEHHAMIGYMQALEEKIDNLKRSINR